MKNIITTVFLLLSFALSSQEINFEQKVELIKKYEKQFDTKKIKEISNEIIKDKQMSYGLLSWNYNNIIGLDFNSIVITQGDNDTYPLWVLQNSKKIRKDILVVNLELIKDKGYRDKLFANNKIPLCEKNSEADIIHHLTNKQHQRSVYISSSVNSTSYSALTDKLYITGLPFKYSNFKFNNIKDIKTNYENKYLLDYIKTNIYADASNEIVVNSNLNYIPAFILLEDHYQKTGESKKANSINLLIRNISTAAGKEDKLIEYYEKKNRTNTNSLELPLAELHKEILKVNGNMYASATEISNKWYNYFLEDLLYNKEYDLLKKYGSKKVDWNNFLNEKEKKLDNSIIFSTGYPTDDLHPVVNISKEAAEEFCKWLTIKYNSWDNNKKMYNNIVFKLPTEEQWQQAAKANLDAVNYPWDYTIDIKGKKSKLSTKGPKNAKGCYLGNFYVNDAECKDCELAKKHPFTKDGGFFSVRVDSYWPNGLGLYNTVGNVAEMTSSGFALGGSWHDTPENCTIKSKQQFTEPNAWTGFRIFMFTNE